MREPKLVGQVSVADVLIPVYKGDDGQRYVLAAQAAVACALDRDYLFTSSRFSEWRFTPVGEDLRLGITLHQFRDLADQLGTAEVLQSVDAMIALASVG